MPKIYSMPEFFALSPEVIEDLLPVDFIPEVYCRQFGECEYQRFNHMVNITHRALVRLTDGSKLRFYESYNDYIPIGVSDLN